MLIYVNLNLATFERLICPHNPVYVVYVEIESRWRLNAAMIYEKAVIISHSTAVKVLEPLKSSGLKFTV